jgi:hypothetical protein
VSFLNTRVKFHYLKYSTGKNPEFPKIPKNLIQLKEVMNEPASPAGEGFFLPPAPASQAF